MLATLHALLPIVLLIVAGYVFRRRGWVPEIFWPGAEAMVYFVFFPALLTNGIAKADFTPYPVAGFAGAFLIAIIAVSALALVVGLALRLPGPTLTSLFQGALRPNTYVGLAAAGALLGPSGMALTALATAVVVPTMNVLSVLVMIRFGETTSTAPRGRRAVFELATNPLILACALGGALNVSGIGMPKLIAPTFDILGAAALPLGILAAGAGLDGRAVRARVGTVGIAALLKLAVLPLITGLAGRALGVKGVALDAAVLYGCLPVSASAYVLARRMGGDSPLLAGIITATTLGALVAMPIAVAVLDMAP